MSLKKCKKMSLTFKYKSPVQKPTLITRCVVDWNRPKRTNYDIDFSARRVTLAPPPTRETLNVRERDFRK